MTREDVLKLAQSYVATDKDAAHGSTRLARAVLELHAENERLRREEVDDANSIEKLSVERNALRAEVDWLRGVVRERDDVIRDQAIAAHRVGIAIELLDELPCYSTGLSVLSEERVKQLVEAFEKPYMNAPPGIPLIHGRAELEAHDERVTAPLRAQLRDYEAALEKLADFPPGSFGGAQELAEQTLQKWKTP